MTANRRTPKTSYAHELVTHEKVVTKTLREWATTLNLNYRTFSIRYARGLQGQLSMFQTLNPVQHGFNHKWRNSYLN